MTVVLTLISAVLFGGFQPGDSWPPEADSAMALAMDTLNLAREQLDFNRHWALGVHLADSTVLRAIQHVEEIPLILEEHLEMLTDYRLVLVGHTPELSLGTFAFVRLSRGRA